MKKLDVWMTKLFSVMARQIDVHWRFRRGLNLYLRLKVVR
jgi:hypothetical protein